jgi:uncharacterized protein YraI
MPNQLKHLSIAVALLLAAAATASATPAAVTTDLNVRSGQGTQHSVIGVMPEGTVVDVSGCGDGWCFVRDYNGYASARYLDVGSAVRSGPSPYAAAPYVAAPFGYQEPGFSFGFHVGQPRPYRYGWRNRPYRYGWGW